MSFRLVRDERYCSLNSILQSSNRMTYEFNYADYTTHHTLQLDLQLVDIPTCISKEYNLSPKVINQQGHLSLSNHTSAQHTHSIKSINNTLDHCHNQPDYHHHYSSQSTTIDKYIPISGRHVSGQRQMEIDAYIALYPL